MTTPNELRAIAEAATAGPWEAIERSGYHEILAADETSDWYGREKMHAVAYVDTEIDQQEAIARFIATFDPPTVLRLLADLEAAEARGWQPIETAPKDGTKFDAWVPDAFGGYRMAGLSFNTRGKLRQHGLLTEADLPRWPTHWRPLPGPPARTALANTEEAQP